jgi:hypothetical protein
MTAWLLLPPLELKVIPTFFPGTYAYYTYIIISFAAIGAGLKYIDDAFDDGRFSKKKAILTALILVIIWTGVSISDFIAATILFSVLFAVLLTGKVDNLAFKMGSIALISIFYLTRPINFWMIPLFVLILLGITDEKGNDYIENNGIPRLVKSFFSHRYCMKLGVLGLCIAALFPWVYFIAFLSFDLAYDFVGRSGIWMFQPSASISKHPLSS